MLGAVAVATPPITARLQHFEMVATAKRQALHGAQIHLQATVERAGKRTGLTTFAISPRPEIRLLQRAVQEVAVAELHRQVAQAVSAAPISTSTRAQVLQVLVTALPALPLATAAVAAAAHGEPDLAEPAALAVVVLALTQQLPMLVQQILVVAAAVPALVVLPVLPVVQVSQLFVTRMFPPSQHNLPLHQGTLLSHTHSLLRRRQPVLLLVTSAISGARVA